MEDGLVPNRCARHWRQITAEERGNNQNILYAYKIVKKQN